MTDFNGIDYVVAARGKDAKANEGQSSRCRRRRIWLAWGLATMLGAACGGVAIQAVPKPNLVWLTGVATFGLLVGLAQSLVLDGVTGHSRNRLPVVIRWTVSSVTGWTGGGLAGSILTFTIGLILYFTGTADTSWFVGHGGQLQWGSIAILGTVAVSVLQERFLRKKIDASARWSAASVVGWILAWAAGFGIESVMRGNGAANGAAAGAVGGAIAGAITGHALIRILSPRTNEDGSLEGKQRPDHGSHVP